MKIFREITISYDNSVDYFVIIGMLNNLGVEYEIIDGDVITIKYSLDKD